MTMTRTFLKAAAIASFLLLGACQSPMQGMTEDDIYYSPKSVYGIPLYLSPFRGDVTLEERCNAAGGSTTFWDAHGRFFRIDYLKIDEHPMAQAPRFASDQTLLNAVMNNYLREIVPASRSIEDVDTAAREFLKDRDPRALFVIVNLNVDTSRDAEAAQERTRKLMGLTLPNPLASANTTPIRGTYYYGFLLFKRGEYVYVLQHYQPAFMPEKMLEALTRLSDHLIVPGKQRADTEIERVRERWHESKWAQFGNRPVEGDEDVKQVNPVRPCD